MIGMLTTGKFARLTVTGAVVFGLSIFAAAQAAPAAGAPAAAPPDSPSAAAVAAAKFNGTKIGVLAVEEAIGACNEGQRDLEGLRKKFEPKESELKGMNDEIDSLKKQLSAQQDKLNDESREKLVKQIEAKQKSFDRAAADAKEDFQNQAGEIENRILTKMVPVIQKYVVDNGYGLLIDTSQTWPRGPVILAGPALDITPQVVEAYNVQSGVPAPAPSSTTPKPASSSTAPKPAPKPAPAKSTAPASTTPKP